MKSKKYLLVLAFCIAVVVLFVVKKHFEPFKLSTNMPDAYKEAVSGQFQGRAATAVLSVFGKPVRKSMMLKDEIWSYPPRMDDLRNAKPGEVIGVNFYIGEDGTVVRCTGVYKDR